MTLTCAITEVSPQSGGAASIECWRAIGRKIRQKERDGHKIFPFPGEVPQYLYHAKYGKESCCVLYTVFLHDTTKSKHFSC